MNSESKQFFLFYNICTSLLCKVFHENRFMHDLDPNSNLQKTLGLLFLTLYTKFPNQLFPQPSFTKLQSYSWKNKREIIETYLKKIVNFILWKQGQEILLGPLENKNACSKLLINICLIFLCNYGISSQ